MFRKVKAKDGRKKIQRQSDNDEQDDTSPTDEALHEQISRIKKKRKLISDLHQRRNVIDADNPSGVKSSLAKADTIDQDPPSTMVERQGDTHEENKDSILQLKHKEAKEAFIKSRLQKGENNDGNFGNNSNDTNDLLKQLSSRPDDVGTGGELVAGTGIAEVILPSHIRERTVTETQALLKARNDKKRTERKGVNMNNNNTTSFVLPNRFAAAKPNINGDKAIFGSNLDEKNESSTDKKQEQSSASEIITNAAEVDTANDGRIGFERLKQIRNGGSGTRTKDDDYIKSLKHKKSTDNSVYKKFITKDREHNRNR